MCLAIPAQVIELLPGDEARIDLGGIRKTISVAIIDSPAVGDYVIVHVGFAIGRIDPEEAARTLAMFGEMELAQQFQEVGTTA